MKPLYFDYASTTPVDQRVIDKMKDCLSLDGNFGNPGSRSHAFGWQAEELVEEARINVSTLVNCDPREIIWTSGATESDNLAIKGAANFYKEKGNHIITSKIEHKAVLDTCRQLESEGFEVTYLDPNENGEISIESIEENIREETTLVSLMHINNEIGVVNDIEKIGELCRNKGIIFHVDAAQSAGKIEIDLSQLKVDLMSFSAHKIYGPKGIGALFVRRRPRIRLQPLFHGGGQERGIRAGTLPTHQIVGMGEAFKLSQTEMQSDLSKISSYRDILWNGLSEMEEIYVNGSIDNGYPGIFNLSFNYVEGESLIMALKNIAVSSGSACTSASLEPSYVLRALGRPDELAHSSIRFSFGRFTKEEEVKSTVKLVQESVAQLREISPLWEMYQDGVDLDKIEWA
ncbi:IscS subfamily cysteine desulfurase [SAR86 cluster bacterium]|jgi:cysteine desulfurase|nr:IscS subfamily cysteine desulfurase [SAR86 cluster bacterium]|tara:strand:+ start:271 stop:1476 length:1206 start_codon:yes stop_codon:yes gene_type:complete